jgi:hypothetical protein
MKFNNTLRFTVLLAALLVFAGTAAAQGPSAGNTTFSSLEMTAEVQTTLQLNIDGTAVTGDNATGLFSIAFGDVDALGLSPLATGVTQEVGATGTLYKSAITLTPVFTGFVAQTADITVEARASADQDLAREGLTLSGTGGTAPAAPVIVVTDGANGSENGRYVGFFIPKSEVGGVKTATLVYTLTVAP